MKKLVLWAFFLFGIGLNAQVNVTTLTPEIEGSGGLSLDADGNLIIADFGDFLSVPDPDGLPNHILSMAPDLTITQYSTGFVGASGNDFDSNGVLFQSDIRAGGIYKIVEGIRTFVTSTGISAPVGIAFDSNDNFFVCNCGNNTIRKVTSGGVSTQFASGGIFSCPNGITVDEDDNLYVSNFGNGSIIKITPAGDTSVLVATPGGTTSGPSNGHLDYYEPSRTLFIASHGSNRIFAIRLDDPGTLIDIAGSGVRGNDDGDGASATFSRPNGVAVTTTGDSIYINSAVPLTNVPNGPLNPQLIRLITGVNSILGLEDNIDAAVKVKVYPNPVIDQFTIEANLSSSFDNLNLTLHDLQGRVLQKFEDYSTDGQHLKITLDVSNMQSGTYFYVLNDGSNQLFNGKVIKK